MSRKNQNNRAANTEKETEVLMADQEEKDTTHQDQTQEAPSADSQSEEQGDNKQQATPDSQSSVTEKASEATTEDAVEVVEAEHYRELQEQYEQLNNKYLRLAAEFDNYKKRMDREFTRRVQFANEEFLREILPILDDLERAMESSGEGEEDEATLKSGIELVQENFKNILKRRGVEAIESVGQPFDPELHDAVMVQESDKHDSETVIREFEKGYKLGDKVLRHAKVVVSR